MTLELKEPVPEAVDTGTDLSFAVVVAAPHGCSLRGTPFKVVESGRVLLAGELSGPTGSHPETVDICVAAPPHVGEFTWAFVVPARKIEDVLYEEASLSFSFKTRAHETTLAVWDNPSPVVGGGRFSVKVGAKCAVGCPLEGRAFEMRDQNGATTARGTLGTSPWPGTTALYWTLVDLEAPAEEGRFSWTLTFPPTDLPLPHGGASASFSFTTTRPPEHSVCVTIVEKDTGTPVRDARVRLGVHRGATDETGRARFAVPAGTHRLSVWKAGYDTPESTVQVTKDEELGISMTALPEEDPFTFWRG